MFKMETPAPAGEPTLSTATVIPPKKRNKLIFIVPLVCLLVLGGAFTYSYLKTKADLETALSQTLQTYSADYKVDNLTIFPLGADYTMLLTLKNPSTYNLDLKVELNLYYDNSILFPFKGEISLPSGKADVLQFQTVHVGTEAINKLNDPSKIRWDITVTATTKVWGFVPVEFVKTETKSSYA